MAKRPAELLHELAVWAEAQTMKMLLDRSNALLARFAVLAAGGRVLEPGDLGLCRRYAVELAHTLDDAVAHLEQRSEADTSLSAPPSV